MANVKFFKGTCTDTTKYVAGGIYFDSVSREIRLGNGGIGAAGYTAYGNHIKDAVFSGGILTISYYDKDSVSLNFNDLASAEATMKAFEALDNKIAKSTPIKGNDIAIGEGTTEGTSINVALGKEITVAGGPLADDVQDNWPAEWMKNNVKTIPQGLSLTEILTKLFLKELQPGSSAKPSISISKKGPASGLHEIGETINVGTATISKTDGHFNNNGWTSPTQPTATFSWSDGEMSSKLTKGAEGYAAQTDVASIAQGTAKTVKGTNEVTITASADYSAPTNKPITNLSNASDIAAATWVAGTAKSNTTITWTGVYPCFTNIANKTLTETANTKLALTDGNQFELRDTPSEVAAGRKLRFAYPEGWTISSFEMLDPSGTWAPVGSAYNSDAGKETKSIQGVDVTYHYLETAGGAGSQNYRITLNKNLNA